MGEFEDKEKKGKNQLSKVPEEVDKKRNQEERGEVNFSKDYQSLSFGHHREESLDRWRKIVLNNWMEKSCDTIQRASNFFLVSTQFSPNIFAKYDLYIENRFC